MEIVCYVLNAKASFAGFWRAGGVAPALGLTGKGKSSLLQFFFHIFLMEGGFEQQKVET
jgi:hypothetical protein